MTVEGYYRGKGGMRIGDRVVTGTPKSILFIGTDGKLAQDTTNFKWDQATNSIEAQDINIIPTDSMVFGDIGFSQDVTLSARNLDLEAIDGTVFHDLANITIHTPIVEFDGSSPFALNGYFQDLRNKSYIVVSFGHGEGGESNYTVASFEVIDFHNLAYYALTDPGSNYVTSDGTGNNDYYLVPVSGLYMVISSMRNTDGSIPQDLGIGTNNIAHDGSNVGYDSASFHWSRVPISRNTIQDVHIKHFSVGDHIALFAFSDSGTLTCSDGFMSITLLLAD